MHSPYSLNYADSFSAAQLFAGLTIAALLLFWQAAARGRSPLLAALARGAALTGVFLTTVANHVAPFVKSVGHVPSPNTLAYVLALAAACGTASALLTNHRVLAGIGLAVQLVFWQIVQFVKDSDFDLAALHLAWLGLLAGLLLRADGGIEIPTRAAGAEPDYRKHDGILFAGAALLSTLVCLAVMHRGEGSADEWAYTFQAASFAKARIYANIPACQTYLRNFYVFAYGGKLFCLYTPGWPLFLAPFMWIRAPWLAGPVAMGFLAVGLARLGRSAWRASERGEPDVPSWVLASAGSWAAFLIATGVMLTINAGSRYPHIYAMALYTWALEAMMTIARPGLSPRGRWAWGVLLGATSALLLATRPAEGATMGVGMAVAFVMLLVRRRVAWPSVAGAAAAFAGVSLVMLVILRVQVGTWLTTGYALNKVIYPWNVTKYDLPKPDEWKYGLPLGMSSYCWWPCSWPLGLAGLASLRRRSTELLVAFAVGSWVYLLHFEWLDQGQRGMGSDWGYGPRYLMLLLVPLAIGCGLAIAPLAAAAMQKASAGERLAFVTGGPMTLVVFAIVCGFVRILPLVWPTASEHARRHSGLQSAISEMGLTNAVVMAKPGTTGFDQLDITTNLPVDLYPNQDAIIAVDKTPDAVACLKREFPTRSFYSAQGVDPVRIIPF